jgi:hypothetical protein
MGNQIYFSPNINALYKDGNRGNLNGINQTICIKTPLNELMLLEQQRHQSIIEQLKDVKNSFQQLSNKWENQQSECPILNDQQLSIQDLIYSIEDSFQKQLRKVRSTLNGNLQQIREEIKNKLDTQQNCNHQSQDQHTNQLQQLINNLEELKELFQKHKVRTGLFKLGDRITLFDSRGIAVSGVFVESTEDTVIWVNDVTNRLSITNIYGLTINKE